MRLANAPNRLSLKQKSVSELGNDLNHRYLFAIPHQKQWIIKERSHERELGKVPDQRDHKPYK